jgi:hypothetical protein
MRPQSPPKGCLKLMEDRRYQGDRNIQAEGMDAFMDHDFVCFFTSIDMYF